MTTTISTVWDRAAEFLSDNLATVTPIGVLALFVPTSLFGNLMPLVGSIDQGGGLIVALLLFALSLVSLWGTLAVTALALDPAAGRAAAIAAANRRLLPVLGIGVVLLLATIVLSLPFALALGMSGVDMAAVAAGRAPGDTPNPIAALFVVLYAPVFALLLLWLSARLVLVNPIMVAEQGGLGALARSFALTHAVQWKLVGVLLLYAVVTQVAALAARTVFGSVFALLIGGDGPITIASVLTSIIIAGISTVFSLMAIAFIAKLYLATRDARGTRFDAAVGGA